jgi:Rrf2 family transcriptional regulator, cysteine metabolism repressor
MKISSRCEYGLRAMVYLAARYGTVPVPLTEMARAEEMPAAFLERILARLREGGLVATTRGAGGGYRLAREASAISVGDVVTAIEGPLTLIGCVPDDKACERADGCASRRVWRLLDEAICEALDGISLEDLVSEVVVA